MKLSEVKMVLKELITQKVHVTPMLWGRHGIGKSSILRQLAEELNYKLIVVTLSQKEAVDLAGVLYTYEDAELGMSVTASHPPKWVAEAIKNGGCILFMDEFNMARREVLNAAFELVLDRRLNNLYFKDDVFVVCAGNPDDDRYDVTPLSESLRDRLMHIKVDHDVDGWLKWAQNDGGIHSDIVDFIKVMPDAAYQADAKDEGFPVEIKHSERSWERLSKIHSLSIPMSLKTECYRGIVGLELATAFIKTLDKKCLPIKPYEIFKGSKATLEKVEEYATVEPLRVDVLAASIEALVKHLESYVATEAEVENAIKFIELLPADLASKAIEQLVEFEGWLRPFEKSKIISSKIELLNSVNSLGKVGT